MNKAFQFKITIKGIINPPVWRRVIVPETFTFEQFHQVLQSVFNRTGSSQYQFSPDGYGSYPIIAIPHDDDFEEVDDAETISLKDIFDEVNQTYIYLYDFNNLWQHEITFEAKLLDFSGTALCITGWGASPPEDCGGYWKYEHIKEIMADQTHPEYRESRDLLALKSGEKWDANMFDIKNVRHYLYKKNLNKKQDLSYSTQLELFDLTPGFNHKDVNLFYCISYNFDRDKLHEIMALPRLTLIEDMKMIMMDCIERHKFFSRYNKYDNLISFPFHALYILSSLRAEEALDTFLLLLTQKNEVLRFWFFDLITEEFWQHLYFLGQHQTDKLMLVFKTEGVNFSVRHAILDAITQIALRQPERKQEVIKWETEAADFLIENIENESVFDPFLFEDLIIDLATIGDMSLLPLMERYFSTENLYLNETCTLDEITKKLQSYKVDRYYDIFNLCTDIDQFYDEWEKWGSKSLRFETAKINAEIDSDNKSKGTNMNTSPEFGRSITPFVAPLKVGRNDPCPCGSGKKYKKCCGIN